MKIIKVPLAVLRFQYRVVRLPLKVIEDQVGARMGSEAPARLFYERSLGLLDATVGNVIGDPKLAKRGAALAERSDALGRAARLDAAATVKQDHADAELKATRDKAIEDQKKARAAQQRAVEETRTAADERERAAKEAAEKRIGAAKKQADDVAARRKNAAEAARREQQAKIRASEQKAAAAAASKLKDAQAKRSVATAKRTQADRVEKLADAEKQNRRSGRAKNNA